MKLSVRKLTLLALYTTVSLAVYAIESALPPFIPFPGVKPGLANIITLLVLHRFSAKEASLVLTARILLSTLLFGQALSLFYSLAGGTLSLTAMVLLKKLLGKNLLIPMGITGGLVHNLGQLLVAFLFTQTLGVLTYLPILILGGIAAGLLTGVSAQAAVKYLSPQLNRHLRL